LPWKLIRIRESGHKPLNGFKCSICENRTKFFLIIIGIITFLFPIFIGSCLCSEPEEYFSIVVLPDTQYYHGKNSWIFENQTKWIVENKETLNIAFVTHLGDLVDDYEDIEEWNNANSSMSILDDVIPYGVLPGNHDGLEDGSNLINYNKHFGFNRYANQTWYGGAFQNINSNSYQFFSAGGDDFLFFHIQYNPSNEVLNWASEVIDKYPNKKVIISTHDYVQGYGTYTNSRSKIGENIWEKLVKPHANQIFLVLSGHYEYEDRITSLESGYYIHQLLSDYQDRSNGGNGWLRIINFSTLTDEISIKTYSPSLNRYEIDSNSQFFLDKEVTESSLEIIGILQTFIVMSVPIIIIILLVYFILKITPKLKNKIRVWFLGLKFFFIYSLFLDQINPCNLNPKRWEVVNESTF
jgi:hypothetical protein